MHPDPFRDAASTKSAIREAHAAIDQMEMDARRRDTSAAEIARLRALCGDAANVIECEPNVVVSGNLRRFVDRLRAAAKGGRDDQ